jgi:nicotinamide mononucleotide transporter
VLGVLGPRFTWPWWGLSSFLYAIFFYQSEYYASAALQFIFIAGGIWGWFGWGPKGAKPRKLKSRERLVLFVLLFISMLFISMLFIPIIFVSLRCSINAILRYCLVVFVASAKVL